MSIKDIITVPDEILKKVSAPIEKVGSNEKKLIQDLFDTMYKSNGIGLAAVQVGILRRILVIDISTKDEEKKPLSFINPVIKKVSSETSIYEEGCLSIPDTFIEIERPKICEVEFVDINGKKNTTYDVNPTSPAGQGCTDTSGTWVIGGTNDTSNGYYMYKGYLSDVRFVVGTAVYTGNFYPPTGPLTQTGGTYNNGSGNVNTSITAGHTKLLLNFTDSKLIDQGSNVNYKSSGSVGSTGLQKYSVPSLEFNTSGDHLTIPTNTQFQKWSPNDNWLGYAPSPFTVECWVYLNSFDTSNLPFIWSAHDSSGAPEISFDSSRNPTWKWGNTNRITSSIAVALTTWTHIAITRDHGTTKMYVDGVLAGSVADTTDYQGHGDFTYTLGRQKQNAAKRLVGYISQFKITQGEAIYPFITRWEPFTTT